MGYDQKESFVEFYVMADGKDLPQLKSDEIFERFKACEDLTKPGSGSLGLGMTISGNFIESMGGHTWI